MLSIRFVAAATLLTGRLLDGRPLAGALLRKHVLRQVTLSDPPLPDQFAAGRPPVDPIGNHHTGDAIQASRRRRRGRTGP